ncbi:hypothetical protein H6G26_30915 [Nostoc sp. FACHB-888]|nr:hypothetical protein [Nostoc sp. FACHB-888]
MQGSWENSEEVGIVFGAVVGIGAALGVEDGEPVGVEDGAVGERGIALGSGDTGDVCCPSICCVGRRLKLVETSKQQVESRNFIFIKHLSSFCNVYYFKLINKY